MNSKLEQLDKAIAKYNQENEKLAAMKREYETLMRKVKLEAREVDKERKRISEDVEKQH